MFSQVCLILSEGGGFHVLSAWGVVYPEVGYQGSDRVSRGIRHQRGIYPTPPGYAIPAPPPKNGANSEVGTHPTGVLSCYNLLIRPSFFFSKSVNVSFLLTQN